MESESSYTALETFSTQVQDTALYTVKKVRDFPVSSQEVTNQTLAANKLFFYSVQDISGGKKIDLYVFV